MFRITNRSIPVDADAISTIILHTDDPMKIRAWLNDGGFRHWADADLDIETHGKLPHVGALWVWRGNNYDVLATFGETIRIREHGAELDYYQTRVNGKWTEPTR